MDIRALFVIVYLLSLVFLVHGSQKKGVVHRATSFMCDDFKVLDNMTWWYDFRISLGYFYENDICNSTIDNYETTHVPMVWGYWKTTEISIAPEAQYVLGFNEPNHKKQSNMTPKKAAAAWPELEKKSYGKPLVSPSAAKCGSECISNEIDWFDKFFKLCKGCRVDYLATHTYWCEANKVMRYLKTLHKRYGRKIWLTEFACSKTTSPARQLSFMKQLLPMLEDADFIYRYAWYSARLKKSGFVKTSASLLEKDSSTLTALGRYYNGFQAFGLSENKEKATPNIPDKHNTGTPSEKETTHAIQATSKSGGEETLLILQSFTSNPTSWWKIL